MGTENLLLHELKHHWGFLCAYVQKAEREQLRRDLLRIGHSQMDLYYGPLAPEDLKREIAAELNAWLLNDRAAYRQWLAERAGYGTVQVSDGSVWVLREGGEDSQFVHLHPGRYSPHTIRVKANTLKTAILLAVLRIADEAVTAELINALRQEYLDASPVRESSGFETIRQLARKLKRTTPVD